VEDDGAEAVAEAGARAEVEAPTGTTSGGEAAAVAEAVEAGRLSDAADGIEMPGERPPQAGTAWPPWSWPVCGGWPTPNS
jgi:hypothetical protein